MPCNISVDDLSAREIVRQQQLDKFWITWSNDYLRNLPPVVKGFVSNCDLKIGSVVLVKEDQVPRMSWPLGIVVKVFPGKDGKIRSVNVKTAKGIFCRPVQRLHDLEISNSLSEFTEESISSEQGVVNVTSPGDNVILDTELPDTQDLPKESVTRKGRVVKPPVKLDL